MKRIFLALLLLVSPAFAQRPALTTPVIRFFDSSGKPLAFGTLQSFQAGTTTPLSTFVDSTTGAVNPNTIPLDATGSATVFLGANVYKFVLKNSSGVVQWTADNIAEGAFQASYVTSFKGRTGAVVPATGDYTCSQVTGCPTLPTIYNQTIEVAGSAKPQELKLNFIAGTSGSVGSPTITAPGTGYTGAPSVVFSGGGCTTEPTGSTTVASGGVTALILVTTGAGCTSAPTPAFSGGGGTGVTATVSLIPDGISCVDNPGANSTDCMFTFGSGGGSGSAVVQNDVTSTRVFGTSGTPQVYQNTTTTAMYVSGLGTITGGGGDSMTACFDGPSSISVEVWANTQTATSSGATAGFSCFVPAGYFYEVMSFNHVSTTPTKWIEYTGFGGGTGGTSISLTTTGTSGAATLVGSTLNIPVYSSGGGNTTSTSLATNILPKANGANSIINSTLTDNGTAVSTTEPFTATHLTDSSLTSGDCVQSGTAGILSSTAGPCAFKGSAVTVGGVPIWRGTGAAELDTSNFQFAAITGYEEILTTTGNHILTPDCFYVGVANLDCGIAGTGYVSVAANTAGGGASIFTRDLFAETGAFEISYSSIGAANNVANEHSVFMGVNPSTISSGNGVAAPDSAFLLTESDNLDLHIAGKTVDIRGGNQTSTSAGLEVGAANAVIMPLLSGCLAADATTHILTGSGSACGSGGGAVSSVSNSDSTLTVSPTTGAVVASLNLAHANNWTGVQTFTNGFVVPSGGVGTFNTGGFINANELNGTLLSGLATGIYKNTTGTGVPSIAVAADFPTLNQNTTGTASNLSGTPALPNGTTATTQTAGDSTTKLATDAFVVGQAGTATPLVDGTAAVGTSLLYARQDHVHPTDTSRAPLASPTFTGTVTLPAGQVVNGVTLTTGGGTTNFLRADGTYAAPSGTGNTTSTSLTTNTLPKANGANSIIDSSISDSGSLVSTGEPLAALTLRSTALSVTTLPICPNGASGTFTVSGCNAATATNLLICADTSASGTAQTCTTTPTFTPAASSCVVYTTTTANSGSGLTLNVNALGAKSVSKWMGSTTTLAANDVLANKATMACYDGTTWELSDIGNAPAGGSASFSTLTGGTNTTAAMVLGSGSSLTVSGTGTNNATTLLGSTWAVPAALGSTTPAAVTGTTITASNLVATPRINGTGSTNTLQLTSSSGVLPATGSAFVMVQAGGNIDTNNVATTTLTSFKTSNTFSTLSGTLTVTAPWIGDEFAETWGVGGSTAITYNSTTPMTQVHIIPTINVTTASTGHYDGILFKPTETSIGTGVTNYFWEQQNAAGTTVSSMTTAGTLSVVHEAGIGTAPTIAAGTGAGTGPTITSTLLSDMSGYVQVLTGTVPAATASVFTITFGTAYGTAPKCGLLPDNAVTQALTGIAGVQIFDPSTTVATATSGATALVSATTYKWSYFCNQ